MKLIKILAILGAACIVAVAASAQDWKCVAPEHWVSTSYGGHCTGTGAASQTAPVYQQQAAALPHRKCQTDETWIAGSLGGDCVNTAMVEALRKSLLDAQSEASRQTPLYSQPQQSAQPTIEQQQMQAQIELQREQMRIQQQQFEQQLDLQRRTARAEAIQRMLQMQQANRFQPSPPPTFAPVAPVNGVNCTTTYIGNTAYTNCR